MSTEMLIFIIVMSWTLIIHGGLTYLIVKKKDYSLISGFNNRSKEEQEYLINKGYTTVLGKIFTNSFYLLLFATFLTLFRVPFGVEIGFGLFTVFLLGGLVYLQKFEVPHKRKKYMWIIGSISVITVVIISSLWVNGSAENNITLENDQFIITGTYGVEWSIEKIERVELLEELPVVIMRTNGYSSGNVRKGKFRLEEPYGVGRLFITQKEGPFLYISLKDDYIILNGEKQQETLDLYERLKEEI
ncbi:DUF3784 domain-containing protein [Paucisalibacillus sp. EB02]|uniref:DUF3784 domain-containing protein n=1 Tax=Paucisalibacillus sp. EB02 TaxID=1347087 RepID=UPI0005A6A9B5|nr:DUF3784 domain-containing protein [Paucisalibacillus sp. EB02]